MKDLTEGKLDEALEFARKNGDTSLQRCLDRLKKTEENWNDDVVITIQNDFAPFSFYFVKTYKKDNHFISNGGIIFHGAHDGFGSGGAPTFSVTIDSTSGWAIHT